MDLYRKSRLYMDRSWPIRIPQQVLRFTPTRLDEPVQFVQAKGGMATYDPRSDTVVLNTQVSNIGNQTVKLVGFATANLTFSQSNGLSAEPAAVGPRQTVPLKVTIQNKVWSEERLIPLDKPQMGIAGRLAFQADDKQTWATIEAPVTPTTFK